MHSFEVSAETIQKLDQEAINQIGVPSIVLMENAGRVVAQEIRRLFKDRKTKKVTLVCGTGNNGGDGFVVARHLMNADFKLTAFLVGSPDNLKPDAATNYQILKKVGFPVIEIETFQRDDIKVLKQSDIAVDAIFGVGLNREIEDPIRAVIETVNRDAPRILSIDVPSGLDATTGDAYGIAIRASRTVTFTFPKTGFSLKQGPAHTGKVIVRDIGIPQLLKDKLIHASQ